MANSALSQELTAVACCGYQDVTLRQVGIDALCMGDPIAKAEHTMTFCNAWARGDLSIVKRENCNLLPPDEIVRSIKDSVRLRNETDEFQKTIQRMIRKNCIEFSVHAIANAELYAIDLFWDLIVRFSYLDLPKAFYDDMVFVVNQEAQHFLAWNNRLEELSMPFGSFPLNNSLWRSAMETKGIL
jgi:uncharacterized ferritin-like protein (DUF455 family)